MSWNLIFGRERGLKAESASEVIAVGGQRVPLRLVRHPRARRYLLRLLPDGTARVTIPRGGSAREARSFAGRQTLWLEKQLHRLEQRPAAQTDWAIGTAILFRGETVTIESPGPGIVHVGSERVRIADSASLRSAVQEHLHRLAARELPTRVLELAHQHGVAVSRVSVRNQRSRWGSCSRSGTISLNWRLIQLPAFVSDYVILHELMHRRHLNHSARFWREVESVCPEYQKAEASLKQYATLLG